MKKQKLLGKILLCCLLCGYNGIGEATETEVQNGAVRSEANVNGDKVYAASDTTYNVLGSGANTGGIIGAQNGGSVEFRAGSTVNINNNGVKVRSIYVGPNSTGSFAGAIDTTNSSSTGRTFHVDSGYAEFTANSTNTVKTTGNQAYGFIITGGDYGASGGVVDFSGTMTTTTTNGGAGLSGNNNITVHGSALALGTLAPKTRVDSTLNLKGAATLTAIAEGNSIAALVDRKSHLITEAGTTLNIESKADGQTALWVRGSEVKTQGEVTITSNKGNAIFLADNYSWITYQNTVDIDGATNQKDIKITGDLQNYASTAGSHLNISMATNDSFLTGHNNLVGNGQETNLSFGAESTWTGNNNLTATNGVNTITLNGTTGNKWEGSSTVNSAGASNTITLSGDGSLWKGSSTLQAGTNTINISNKSTMEGAVLVEAGTNKINVDESGYLKGDTTLNGGTNDLTMTGGTVEGSISVHNASTNTINMQGNNSLITGGTITVDNAAATNTMTLADNAIINNALINSAGTMTGTFSDSSKLTADNSTSGGTTALTFGDTSAWENGNNNATGGTTTVTLNGTTGNKWTGSNTVNGANANNIVTLSGAGSLWDGDSILQAGTNTINISNTSRMEGSVLVNAGTNIINMSGDAKIGTDTTTDSINVTGGSNTMTVNDQAEIHNKLVATGGTMTGTFNTDAKLLAANEVGDATTKLTFNGDSQWTGDNTVNGKGADFTAEFYDNSKWQGDNNVSYGIANITLSDAATWGEELTPVENKVTDDGKNTINLLGFNKWYGNSTIDSQSATNTINILIGNSLWQGDNTTTAGTNTITLSGVNNKWKGNSTTEGGTNTITVSGTSAMDGKNTINGGTNKINVTDSGTITNTDPGATEVIEVTGGTNTVTMANSGAITGNVVVNNGSNSITMADSSTITGDITLNNGTNDIAMTGGTITGNVVVQHGTNTINMGGSAVLKGGTISLENADAITNLTVSGNAQVDNILANKAGTLTGTFAGTSTLTKENNMSGGTTDLVFAEDAAWVGDNYVMGGTNSVTFTGTTGNTWKGANIVDNVSAVNTITLSGTESHWDGTNSVNAGTNSIVLTNTSTWNGSSSVKDGTNSITLSGAEGNMWTGKSTVDGTNAVNNITLTGNGARWEGDNEVLAGTHTGNFSGQTSWEGNSLINGTDAVSENSFSDKAAWNGDNTVVKGSSTLDFKNDAIWNGDNTIKGGTHVGNFADDTAWGGNNITEDGTNTTNVQGASTWTGDNLFTGGTSKLTVAGDATWLGNNLASGAGTNEVVLKGTADWEGMSNDSAGGTSSVSIEDNAIWFMHGNSMITNLNVQDQGTVDMVNNLDGSPKLNNYETLTVDNLKGSGGAFIFDTDLDKAVIGSETTDGDKLVVNGTSTGKHYVQVSDASLYTGTEINGDRKLLLITDLSEGNYEFIGKALNQGGLWQVNPPTFFQEGNKWYLGYLDKEPNPDTTVSVLDRHTVYNQWTRINNDSLRKRLGDLRYNDSEAGVWARFYSGKLGDTGYTQSYHTYQVGVDKTNGRMTYGLAYDRQETTQSYDHGNGKGSNNNVSVYATHYTPSGSYWDAVAKYGRLGSEYKTTGDYPDSADYATHAYSLSAEYGKTNKYAKGYYVEPKVQLTYGYLSGENYTTKRNTAIREEAIESLISRVGLVAGRKINKDSDYYLKLNWFKEFKGNRSVFMAAANGEKMPIHEDLSDSWWEIGVGGNVKIAKKTHVYGDVERSLGARVEKKWQVNAGVRWEF